MAQTSRAEQGDRVHLSPGKSTCSTRLRGAMGATALYSGMGTEHSHCGDALDLYGCWLLDSFFLQASQDSCQRTRDNACS